jgi:hypothetical protein
VRNTFDIGPKIENSVVEKISGQEFFSWKKRE